MANETQVNNIAKQIGILLIDNGMKMIQSAFKLNPIKVTGAEITQAIVKYLPSVNLTHLDDWYYLIPISQWKELIAVDWTDTKKWVIDKFDCDNFGNYFSANMAMFYEINSAGRVYGKFYRGTQNFVGYHYWNIIIDSNKDIWFFEPESDKMTEVAYKGGQILIGGNKYEVISIWLG